MKSFSILRTNVGLTTNVKVVVDSSYNLFLESIDSTPSLSQTKLKKFKFNKNNYFDELVPYFFRNFPAEEAFKIRNVDSESSSMSSNFSNQYDNLYLMGARNIIDNKNYSEEYEFFAPLYVFRHSMPKYFIIFRVDGPGILNLNKNNFRDEYLDKLKTVKIFDLTRNTVLGEWIDRSFKSNKNFSDISLEIDFRRLEFSKWYGIDYETGGYTNRSNFLENFLAKEKTLFDFEKYIFDVYSESKIIHPQILNFSFLFDDTPATPTSLRKWSLNRYAGFYLDDLELVDCITPFITPSIKDDVEILTGNILYSPTGDPFINGFNSSKNIWIEYDGMHYKVIKFDETTSNVLTSKDSKNGKRNVLQGFKSTSKYRETVRNEQYGNITTQKYRIISDIDLTGKQSLLNKKTFYVNGDNQIVGYYGDKYVIDDWDKSDVHLIEINGTYHNLVKKNDIITLNTDYAFDFNEYLNLSFWINNKDPEYLRTINLEISPTNDPFCFKVYSARFTDIKDFDNQIIENDFSRYEYEKANLPTNTFEPKMYTTDFRTGNYPAIFSEYIYKDGIINIPASSDYTANLETFRIIRKELTDLWKKNPVHLRFGYQNSISKANVPYLLNNNDIHEKYNRCADTSYFYPNATFRNLDYFYTINSGRTDYSYHSLHIEKNYVQNINGLIKIDQDTSFMFELDKYLNTHTYSIGSQSATYSFDYFSYFFEIPDYFINGKIKSNVEKYSYFESSDGTIPNITLFNGLKFYFYQVDSLIKNTESISDISLRTTNILEDYKLSILLSQNVQHVNDDNQLEDLINWGNFTHVQTEGSNIAYRTSETATPSNIFVNDVVNIQSSYPFIWKDSSENVSIAGLFYGDSTVQSVGQLSSGGYGFVISKTHSSAFTYSQTGTYKVNFVWKLIKPWELGSSYIKDDIIIWDDILYKCDDDFTLTNPNLDPLDAVSAKTIFLYSDKQPFWNPDFLYSDGDWIYREGDFWRRNSNDENAVDFYYPKAPYDLPVPNDIQSKNVVIRKGRYFLNQVENNFKIIPQEPKRKWDISVDSGKEWKLVPSPKDWGSYDELPTDVVSSKWDQIGIWISDESYADESYVVYKKTLYRLDDPLGSDNDIPGISPKWTRLYSFGPDSDVVYSPTNNEIIGLSGNYYICAFNKNYTLDNGITIYINKKWKNVLINIAVNDNTLSGIDNDDRNYLYSRSNTKITANNFIKQINDLDSKYEFIDYTSYVIIEEDGTFKKYNFNNSITDLPYVILCSGADDFEVDTQSLLYSSSLDDIKAINPQRVLNAGKIDNLNKINYYSGIPISYSIDKDKRLKSSLAQTGGSKSNIVTSNKANIGPKTGNSDMNNTIFRHSGNYMPMFYDIELFKSSDEFGLSGNYLFDVDLTLFGIMRQRVISKVSRSGNILKLRSIDGSKSIYPMLDEFGFTVSDFFIFKSSWDFEYFFECSNINTTSLQSNIINNGNKSGFLRRSIDQKVKNN